MNTRILRNERGSIIVIALLILMLLAIIGKGAMDTTNIESTIARNETEYKLDLYATEGGGPEVAWDVDHAGPSAQASCPADRLSCSYLYGVLDITQPRLMTSNIYVAAPADINFQGGGVLPTQVNSSTSFDPLWPTNYNGTSREYAFRVWYRSEGSLPKGYGPTFASYIFDITCRKQLTVGGNPSMTTIIDNGYIKIGPKT